MPTPKGVRKKGSKILKLPPVRNCFTLAMTNKLVVIINSLKVPKLKKSLLYEMKFLVPNYSCIQNSWLGNYRPQIPVLSVLNRICWPPHRTKFLGKQLTSTLQQRISAFGSWGTVWGRNGRGVCWSLLEPMVSRLVRGGDVTLGYRRLGHTYVALFPGLTASLCYCGNDKMPTNPSPRLPA